MTKDTKSGAPSVGLYLRLGPDLAFAELSRDLREIFFTINGSDYERNMHAIEIFGDASDDNFKDTARRLFLMARNNGIACLYRGDPETAKDLGAEGVMLTDDGKIAAAQALFEDHGIVGLFCGTDAAKAAAAHDAGIDIVSFGTGTDALPPPDVFKFWDALTDKPAILEGPITNDYCDYYIRAGASFIDATEYIFAHGKGVMQGTVNMLYAIDLALEDNEKTVQ